MKVYNIEVLGNLQVIVLAPNILDMRNFEVMRSFYDNVIPDGDITFDIVIDTVQLMISKLYREPGKVQPLSAVLIQQSCCGRKRLNPKKIIGDLRDFNNISIPKGLLSLMLRVDESDTYEESSIYPTEYIIDEEIIICRLKKELQVLRRAEMRLRDITKTFFLESLICTILYLTKYHSEII